MMKKTIKLILVLSFIAALLIACAPKATPTPEVPAPTKEEVAAPANLLEEVQARGKLIVGTSADYPPFEFLDDDGNFAGYDMDLIREIGKRMGVEVEIQDLGFDALIAAVQGRKVDCAIAAMAATEERKQSVDFTQSYNAQKQSFVVAGDSDIEISTPTDVAAYKIGVQSGTTLDSWVVENLIDPGLMTEENLSRYERTDQIALDLKAGRIDVAFLDAGPAKDIQENMGVKVIYTDFIAETGQAIALPQGETALKDAMDKIITDLIDEGFIDQLAAKYITEE